MFYCSVAKVFGACCETLRWFTVGCSSRCQTILIALVSLLQLLQSFKIMDYSLLMGIHNMDQASREKERSGGSLVDNTGSEGAVTPDQRRPQAQKSLYCTAMESIQGEARGKGALDSEDQWVWPSAHLYQPVFACWGNCSCEIMVNEAFVLSVTLQHGWYSCSQQQRREVADLHRHHRYSPILQVCMSEQQNPLFIYAFDANS